MDTKLDKLAAVTRAFLDADEISLSLKDDALSQSARAFADCTMAAWRVEILTRMTAPADAFARYRLLKSAIKLDGVGSVLAAAAARRFAEAAEAEAAAEARHFAEAAAEAGASGA